MIAIGGWNEGSAKYSDVRFFVKFAKFFIESFTVN